MLKILKESTERRLTIKTKKNKFDGTYFVSLSLMRGNEEMICKSGIEKSEIFPTITKLIEVANKHGYEVKR